MPCNYPTQRGVSFAGCITPFRSVQLFCGYTMTGIVFCYLYQLTFTVACMVLAGHAEEQNKHCITHKRIPTVEEASKHSQNISSNLVVLEYSTRSR